MGNGALLVNRKPSTITKPSKATIYHPSVFDGHKASLCRGVVLPNLDHGLEGLLHVTRKHGSSEILVSHHLLQTRVFHSFAVFGHDLFAAFDALAAVITLGLSTGALARFDALAVDHQQRGLRVFACGPSHLLIIKS